MIDKLPLKFDGKGEVKGYSFEQVMETDSGYAYRVSDESSTHYEVFKKKTTFKCIDFEKRIFSDTEKKEVYQ